MGKHLTVKSYVGEDAINGVSDNIYFNSPCHISYKNKGYEIETPNGTFHAVNYLFGRSFIPSDFFHLELSWHEKYNACCFRIDKNGRFGYRIRGQLCFSDRKTTSAKGFGNGQKKLRRIRRDSSPGLKLPWNDQTDEKN